MTESRRPRGSTTTKPSVDAPEPPALDEDGRLKVRGTISYAIVGTYVLLLLLIIFIVAPRAGPSYLWAPFLLGGICVLLLVRYVSTVYTIDDTHLVAWRILGGRKIPLDEVRRIEYASLRDLAPIGGGLSAGSWGWKGRMFSPSIGEFDSIYTDAAHGLLVTAGTFPLYLSPRNPALFARELSRRVRSYSGPLAKDVGDPRQSG